MLHLRKHGYCCPKPFGIILPQQVERSRAELRDPLQDSLNGQSKEQHRLHHVCHGLSGLGLNSLYTKSPAGVFNIYTVQKNTSWLLITIPALLHRIKKPEQRTSTSLALSHLPSHLTTVKFSENVTKVRTTAHNIQHYTEMRAEKDGVME